MNIKEAVSYIAELVESPGVSQKTADRIAVVLTALRSETGMKTVAAEVVAILGPIPEEEQEPRKTPIGFQSYQDLEVRYRSVCGENERLGNAMTETVQKLKRTEKSLGEAEKAIEEFRERHKNQSDTIVRLTEENRNQRRMLTEQTLRYKRKYPFFLEDDEKEEITPASNLFSRREQMSRLVDAWLAIHGLPVNSLNVVTALNVQKLLK